MSSLASVERVRTSGRHTADFCSNLNYGLHALAQPLSVLRSVLDRDCVEELDADDLKEAVATAGREVERSCKIFSCLQQLLCTETAPAEISACDLGLIAARAAADVELLFSDSRMRLKTLLETDCPRVWMDPDRTLQTLTDLLLSVHGLARAQDTVEIQVAQAAVGLVRLAVRVVDFDLDVISQDFGLHLALAETAMRGQRAGFRLLQKPFAVEMEFQHALE
jgi:signal transduction histidine kinase